MSIHTLPHGKGDWGMKTVSLNCGCKIKNVGFISLILMLIVNRNKEIKVICEEHGEVCLKTVEWQKETPWPNLKQSQMLND